MNYEPVIVRDFMGNYLKRVVLGQGKGLVYVANPDHLEAVLEGDSSPIGFPDYDVYVFDEALFSGDLGVMDSSNLQRYKVRHG